MRALSVGLQDTGDRSVANCSAFLTTLCARGKVFQTPTLLTGPRPSSRAVSLGQSPGGVWLPPNLNNPQSYLEIARASFLTASVAILRIMCCENTCPPRLLSLLREQRWQNTTGGVTLDVSQGPTAGGLTVCDRSSHVFQIKPPRQVVQCHVVNLITRSQRVTDLWQSMM